MIDTLSDLKSIIMKSQIIEGKKDSLKISITTDNIFGNMYCPKCSSERRMSIKLLYVSPSFSNNHISSLIIAKEQERLIRKNSESIGEAVLKQVELSLSPSIWQYLCLQCNTAFTALIYQGSSGQALAVLPTCPGGITTLNTPKNVAYYLNQANLAKSVGANSAAMAMFRAALEQLLYEQGYVDGMLDAKIKKLNLDINSGVAPNWALNLETEFLNYLKKIGNGAIHPNKGNIQLQSNIDNELLSKIEIFFSMLLFSVYEAKKQKDDWLNAFKNKADVFNKP